MKIGFVGLGLMGLPMAKRILKNHDLYIFSKNEKSKNILVEEGAKLVSSINELFTSVDILCSCRLTDSHSKEIFLKNRNLKYNDKLKICIDFSTISPNTAKMIAFHLKKYSIDFIDAPISGGPLKAQKGNLTIMAGGEKIAINKARKLFSILGKKFFHVGNVGSGVTAKLCNNLISISTHALICESVILALKSGIEIKKMFKILKNSSASSKSLSRIFSDHLLINNFRANATIETIIKDLDVAIKHARTEGIKLPITRNSKKHFLEAKKNGFGNYDISSLILHMQQQMGFKFFHDQIED